MNFLRHHAPTIDDALNLEVHELAFLLLREMRQVTRPEHAGNWLLRATRLYDPPAHTGEAPPRRRDEFGLAVAEAVGWLMSKNLIATYYDGNAVRQFVTRRGQAVDTVEAFQLFLREAALDPVLLHSVVRAEAWPLYARGKFDLAVFEAFKRVEIAVRNAGGFKHTDLGPVLMRAAFHEDRGPLTDQALPTAERQSISALFAGAIGAFKNPGSHREVGLNDPTRAAELLMFASHLLRIVDDRVSTLNLAAAV
jgi:uncharacterized protein (TIGR02391 family)